MATKEHLEKRAGDRTRETKTTHTLRCSSEEASAYYTRELLFSTSTAMKSRLCIMHECVLNARLYGTSLDTELSILNI